MVEYDYNKVKECLKCIVLAISFALLFPVCQSTDTSFYRTVFVYQIGATIDMIFVVANKKTLENKVMVVLNIVNAVAGAISCAISFLCLAENDWISTLPFVMLLNIMLMVTIFSYLLKTGSALFIKNKEDKDSKQQWEFEQKLNNN